MVIIIKYVYIPISPLKTFHCKVLLSLNLFIDHINIIKNDNF